jgi:sporulation protein YlmC with PRC-barrel domain
MKRLMAGSALALIVSIGQTHAQTAGAPPVPFVVQQPAGEWLASLFIGQVVTNQAGDAIGDINDLVFDKNGRVTTAVLGIGGFLGIGDKSVGVPFSSLSFTTGKDGNRVVIVPLTKETLQLAPIFNPTEKSTYVKIKEKAGDLKDQAGKKIEEMRKDEPKSK